MNREITVEYTPRFTKSILWVLWLHSIGLTVFRASVLACLVLIPIAILIRQYTYILFVVGIAIFIFVFLANQFFPQINSSIDEFHQGEIPVVKFSFMDDTIEIETDDGLTELSWENVVSAYKYPKLWLISFSEMTGYIILPTTQMDRELKQFVKSKLRKIKNKAPMP